MYSLHQVNAAQATAWFPVFMECLLDPKWLIPGLSPWWSQQMKKFLNGIRYDLLCTYIYYLFSVYRSSAFWAYYRPVAGIADGEIIQTECVT